MITQTLLANVIEDITKKTHNSSIKAAKQSFHLIEQEELKIPDCKEPCQTIDIPEVDVLKSLK